MPMTILLAVFASTFALASAVLFASFVVAWIGRLRGKPNQPHVVLGDDLRGRQVKVLDVLPGGNEIAVQIGAERWRAMMASSAGAAKKTAIRPEIRPEIRVGDVVTVNRVEGLTLYVKPRS